MVNRCTSTSLVGRRGLFGAFYLLVLLKNQGCAAFTQSLGSPVSRHPTLKVYDSSAPIILYVKSQQSTGGHISRNNGVKTSKQSALYASTPNGDGAYPSNKRYRHVLAILAMPYASVDRIANEAILAEALQHTNKLSIFLRCEGGKTPSLANLRRYMGEVYSQLWDFAMASDNAVHFNNVVVYPQSLPNAAAEQWIYHLPDLDAICSHDSICGWISEGAAGRGAQFQFQLGDGVGGLDTHVDAVNADRLTRKLKPVTALHVANWPIGASSAHLSKEHVVFVDDDMVSSTGTNGEMEDSSTGALLGGARIPDKSLFQCVAAGGTFDGMHYGHRKLLTLAVSSVAPLTGRLMVGVTVDDMLKSKQYADYIPPMKERMEGVREFLHRLAPGMKNRITIEPISDAYGPPGKAATGKDYDALVLSHETLANGVKLNRHRQLELGLEPLTLLCTRRTEAYGMSSTTLRRLRSMSKVDSVLDPI
jgi:cytidyltransferase-like protein